MSWDIVFVPLLSWPILSILGLLSGVAIGFAIWRRLAGAWQRSLAAALVLLVLTGPVLEREERKALNDIVFVLSDRSSSQKLGARAEQTNRAEADILQKDSSPG